MSGWARSPRRPPNCCARPLWWLLLGALLGRHNSLSPVECAPTLPRANNFQLDSNSSTVAVAVAALVVPTTTSPLSSSRPTGDLKLVINDPYRPVGVHGREIAQFATERTQQARGGGDGRASLDNLTPKGAGFDRRDQREPAAVGHPKTWEEIQVAADYALPLGQVQGAGPARQRSMRTTNDDVDDGRQNHRPLPRRASRQLNDNDKDDNATREQAADKKLSGPHDQRQVKNDPGHQARLMELRQKYLTNRAIGDRAYYLLLVVYSLLIIFGTISNGLICLTVILKPKILSPRNIFIVNLAGSDLLLCVFTMPFSFIEISNKTWQMGLLPCKLVASLQATSIFVSTISITAIALDRYKVIVYPTHQETASGTRGAFILLASVWVGALLLSLPLFRFRTVEHLNLPRHQYESNLMQVNSINFCIEDWPFDHGRGIYSVISMIFQYVLPITIVSVVYAKISDKLQKRLIRRQRNTQLECQQKRQLNLIKRTHNMLISVSLVFGLSWLPLNVLNVISDFSSPLFPENDQLFRIVFAICHLFGCSSACSNPIFYGYMNENFRKEFHQVYTHHAHLLARRLRRLAKCLRLDRLACSKSSEINDELYLSTFSSGTSSSSSSSSNSPSKTSVSSWSSPPSNSSSAQRADSSSSSSTPPITRRDLKCWRLSSGSLRSLQLYRFEMRLPEITPERRQRRGEPDRVYLNASTGCLASGRRPLAVQRPADGHVAMSIGQSEMQQQTKPTAVQQQQLLEPNRRYSFQTITSGQQTFGKTLKFCLCISGSSSSSEALGGPAKQHKASMDCQPGPGKAMGAQNRSDAPSTVGVENDRDEESRATKLHRQDGQPLDKLKKLSKRKQGKASKKSDEKKRRTKKKSGRKKRRKHNGKKDGQEDDHQVFDCDCKCHQRLRQGEQMNINNGGQPNCDRSQLGSDLKWNISSARQSQQKQLPARQTFVDSGDMNNINRIDSSQGTAAMNSVANATCQDGTRRLPVGRRVWLRLFTSSSSPSSPATPAHPKTADTHMPLPTSIAGQQPALELSIRRDLSSDVAYDRGEQVVERKLRGQSHCVDCKHNGGQLKSSRDRGRDGGGRGRARKRPRGPGRRGLSLREGARQAERMPLEEANCERKMKGRKDDDQLEGEEKRSRQSRPSGGLSPMNLLRRSKRILIGGRKSGLSGAQSGRETNNNNLKGKQQDDKQVGQIQMKCDKLGTLKSISVGGQPSELIGSVVVSPARAAPANEGLDLSAPSTPSPAENPTGQKQETRGYLVGTYYLTVETGARPTSDLSLSRDKSTSVVVLDCDQSSSSSSSASSDLSVAPKSGEPNGRDANVPEEAVTSDHVTVATRRPCQPATDSNLLAVNTSASAVNKQPRGCAVEPEVADQTNALDPSNKVGHELVTRRTVTASERQTGQPAAVEAASTNCEQINNNDGHRAAIEKVTARGHPSDANKVVVVTLASAAAATATAAADQTGSGHRLPNQDDEHDGEYDDDLSRTSQQAEDQQQQQPLEELSGSFACNLTNCCSCTCSLSTSSAGSMSCQSEADYLDGPAVREESEQQSGCHRAVTECKTNEAYANEILSSPATFEGNLSGVANQGKEQQTSLRSSQSLAGSMMSNEDEGAEEDEDDNELDLLRRRRVKRRHRNHHHHLLHHHHHHHHHHNPHQHNHHDHSDYNLQESEPTRLANNHFSNMANEHSNTTTTTCWTTTASSCSSSAFTTTTSATSNSNDNSARSLTDLLQAANKSSNGEAQMGPARGPSNAGSAAALAGQPLKSASSFQCLRLDLSHSSPSKPTGAATETPPREVACVKRKESASSFGEPASPKVLNGQLAPIREQQFAARLKSQNTTSRTKSTKIQSL